MRLFEQRTAPFKRAKHSKVSFFRLKNLIDGGEIILSDELVADMSIQVTMGKLLGVMEDDA